MSLRRYGASTTSKAQFVREAAKQNGGVYVSGTGVTAGRFGVLYACVATVIATVTTEQPNIITTLNGTSGTITTVSLAAGTEFVGDITTFTLTSGAVIAYYRP